MKRSEIEALLPSVFQRTVQPGNPLLAILQIMEDLHAPAEEILANLDLFFDPYQTPDDFVPYLASWVDLDRFLAESPEALGATAAPTYAPTYAAGIGQLRELVAAAAELSKWRGTKQGLVRFLETATGVPGFVVDEQALDERGEVQPFHLQINAPAAARPYEALVHRIVALEKPAYMTAQVTFAA